MIPEDRLSELLRRAADDVKVPDGGRARALAGLRAPAPDGLAAQRARQRWFTRPVLPAAAAVLLVVFVAGALLAVRSGGGDDASRQAATATAAQAPATVAAADRMGKVGAAEAATTTTAPSRPAGAAPTSAASGPASGGVGASTGGASASPPQPASAPTNGSVDSGAVAFSETTVTVTVAIPRGRRAELIAELPGAEVLDPDRILLRTSGEELAVVLSILSRYGELVIPPNALPTTGPLLLLVVLTE